MKVSCKNATIYITITDIKLEKVKKKKTYYMSTESVCTSVGRQEVSSYVNNGTNGNKQM